MNKILSILLTIIMTLSSINLFALKTNAATTYTNEYFYVINTTTQTKMAKKATFSYTKSNDNLKNASEKAGYYDAPMSKITDSATGKTLTKTERHFNLDPFKAKITEEDVNDFKDKLKSFDTTEYQVGDTKNLYTDFNETYEEVTETKQIECRYIANHCTVWISRSDDSRIQLSDEQCKKIGDNFDSNWAKELELFGNYVDIAMEDNKSYFQYGDADYDGKLAVICYDIDNNFTSDEPIKSYTGGFYNSLDNIVDKNNVDKVPEYKNSTNLMDCIHIDTFPAMGGDKNKPLTDLDSALGTLYHEGQHLIQNSYGESLPDYLNEGFAMGAEHSIMGDPTVNQELYDSRIFYFNLIGGLSLTYFDGSFYDYSNDYVFTQYLRTQYKQTDIAKSLNDSTGETFYKQVLRNYKNAIKGKDLNSIEDSDYENVILDLLGHSSYVELIKEFWQACILNAPSGRYGFDSEEWSYLISPRVYDPLDPEDVPNVYNGGCTFYQIDGSFTIKDSTENLFIGTLDHPTLDDYNVSDAEQIYDGTQKKITVTPKTDDVGEVKAIIYYTTKKDTIDSKKDIIDQVYVTTQDGKYNESPTNTGKYNVSVFTHGGNKKLGYSSEDVMYYYKGYLENLNGFHERAYRKLLLDELKNGLVVGTFKILNEDGTINVNIYRLYNKNTGEHLFTSSETEYSKLENIGWTKEGKTFETYDSEDKPSEAVAVYRMFNKNGFNGKGDHHYTKSQGEIEKLQKLGWTLDFDGKPAFYAVGSIDVFKLYNPKTGAHHYTPKEGEKNDMSQAGWVSEGVAWTTNAYYTSSGERITK